MGFLYIWLSNASCTHLFCHTSDEYATELNKPVQGNPMYSPMMPPTGGWIRPKVDPGQQPFSMLKFTVSDRTPRYAYVYNIY